MPTPHIILDLPRIIQDNQGTQYVMDMAVEDDLAKIYELMQILHHSGEGFAEHELGSKEEVEAIIQSVVAHHYLITIKTLTNGDIANVMYSSVSAFARSSRPVLHDQWAMVNPDFSGLALGRVSTQEMGRVLHKAGYQGMMTDAFLTAPFAYRVNMTMGGVGVGVIPYAACVKTFGWTDVVCLCRLY